MRTYTDKDGVFVHVDDLANSLQRVADEAADDVARRTLYAVHLALGDLKVAALEDAVARRPETILGMLLLGH